MTLLRAQQAARVAGAKSLKLYRRIAVGAGTIPSQLRSALLILFVVLVPAVASGAQSSAPARPPAASMTDVGRLPAERLFGSGVDGLYPALPQAFEANGGASAAAGPVGQPIGNLAQLAGNLDIPETLLQAYVNAAERSGEVVPGCALRWQVLAGIGRIESNHGRFSAASTVIDPGGAITPPIIGPELNGAGGFAAIPDSDSGTLDGDTVWDRAVGPMQFIPSSWRLFGRDASTDGVADPHNAYDAALAAAAHLCSVAPGDYADRNLLAQGIFGYNRSSEYVAAVLGWIDAYDGVGVPGLVPMPDLPNSSAPVVVPPSAPSSPVVPTSPLIPPTPVLPPASTVFPPVTPTQPLVPPAATTPTAPSPATTPPATAVLPPAAAPPGTTTAPSPPASAGTTRAGVTETTTDADAPATATPTPAPPAGADTSPRRVVVPQPAPRLPQPPPLSGGAAPSTAARELPSLAPAPTSPPVPTPTQTARPTPAQTARPNPAPTVRPRQAERPTRSERPPAVVTPRPAPTAEDPATEEPTTEDPATEDPATEVPTTEEPTTVSYDGSLAYGIGRATLDGAVFSAEDGDAITLRLSSVENVSAVTYTVRGPDGTELLPGDASNSAEIDREAGRFTVAATVLLVDGRQVPLTARFTITG